MKTDKPLTCSTCKYKGFSWLNQPKCYRPDLDIDPVTGEPNAPFCEFQRKYEFSTYCGPSGKYHSSIFPIKVAP